MATRADYLAQLWNDPIEFSNVCWPGFVEDGKVNGHIVYEKQAEVLQSVAVNRETYVHSANQVGKTHLASLAAIWFFASRQPSRVIIFSATQQQAEKVIYPEIKSMISKSEVPFRDYWKVDTSPQIRKWKNGQKNDMHDLDYLIAQVTNTVEAFQGVHLPEDGRPSILAIFDEASGVADEFLEAARSFAHRILVIGNPMNNENFFYRECMGGDIPMPHGEPGLLRKVVHIDGSDSPNVQIGNARIAAGIQPGKPIVPGVLSHQEYAEREIHWKNDPYQLTVRLHGHFYEGEEMQMFPRDWLDLAQDEERWATLNEPKIELDEEGEEFEVYRKVEAIGLDTAEGGGDNTVWTLIDRYGIIEQIVESTGNAVKIAAQTKHLIDTHKLAASAVAIDAGGGGKQVGDILLSYHKKRVKTIRFGGAPGEDDTGKGNVRKRKGAVTWKEYAPKMGVKNRRVEMYVNLQSRMRPEQLDGAEPFMIGPGQQLLRQELAILPQQYDQEGIQMLPPKSPRETKQKIQQISIKQMLGGRSPDRADSLVLAIHALKYARQKPVALTADAVKVDEAKLQKHKKSLEQRIAEMQAKLNKRMNR